MRELKDRIYFFVPTRMSLGILLAYRDDLGSATVGCDLEEIYKVKPCDKDVLIQALGESKPFARLFECTRDGKRLPIIFMRCFADRTAMYCAIELKYSYSDVLSATLQLGYGEEVITGPDVLKSSRSDKAIDDAKLYKYLNTVYGIGNRHVCDKEWCDSPIAVADEIMAICDFLGVRLELDLTVDLDDSTQTRFSFKSCMEMVAVFACVARRYTRKRVLGVELCRCAYNFRVKFLLDCDSDTREREAEDALATFLRMMDVAVVFERGELMTYESMPSEPELEVVGVKEEF